MSNQTCPLCGERKAKRSCPAVGQMICTVCCATKRQIEIRCPADCIYLTSAKSHPPAVIQKRQERDIDFLIPIGANLTQTQYRLMILFQSVTVQHADGALPPLLDSDVADAAAATAATLETASKGIIYEHQAVSVPAQRLANELGKVIGELRTQSGTQQSRLERDAAAGLRAIEEGARRAAKALAGDEPPVYLNVLKRMLQKPAGRGETGEPAEGAHTSGGLIIPGG